MEKEELNHIRVSHSQTATTGHNGVSIAGEYGSAISGHFGTSKTNEYGVSISGDFGLSITNDFGHASSGSHGTLQFRYWDVAGGCRFKDVIGYVGEGGLKPHVLYRLNKKHQIVKARSKQVKERHFKEV